MTPDRALLALRLLAGGVFVAFGVGKFVNHASELASFKTYGLPLPEVFVIVIGVIELAGGALLIAGLLVRPAALVLAGDMVGAIVVSGLLHGENISLTLAPALLVSMVVIGAVELRSRRVSDSRDARSSPAGSDRARAR
jgi:putative oxidoreductase